jgi:hypothetical protein
LLIFPSCVWKEKSDQLIIIIIIVIFYSFCSAVKVLVFLGMPIEPTSNDISQQLEYLWGLKASITCSDVIAVIVSLLESPLENLER